MKKKSEEHEKYKFTSDGGEKKSSGRRRKVRNRKEVPSP